MDHATKAKFVLALHKHSLKALDSGGGVVGGGGSGGFFSDLGGAFTTQNTFQATSPTTASTVGQQQAGLAGQLQNEAAGNGPNPAQRQYLQNAQNIAQQQAGTYASNRALNPGLAARMAGNTAANAQQTAANQSAIQQAEQQLAAQHELQGLTGQEQQGVMGAQGINAQVAQNNANSVNQNESGLVNGIGGAITGPGLSMFGMAKGGDVEMPDHFHDVAKIYHPHMYAGGGDTQGSGMFQMKPGLGGSIQAPVGPSFSNAQALTTTPVIGGFLSPSKGKSGDGSEGDSGGEMPLMAGGADSAADLAPVMALAAHGGYMQKMDSGGIMGSISKLAPLALLALNKGGQPSRMSNMDLSYSAPSSLMKKGGTVKAQKPDQKAKVKDDSLKNDKVPALLSEGEIVIPRHITQHPMAPQKAAAFVQAVLNKRRMGKK